MKDKREMELVNSFKEYLEILIKDFSDIDYNNVKKRGGYIDGRIVRFYRVIICQLVSRLTDMTSKVTVADILRYSSIDEFSCHDHVIIPMRDRFKQIKLCDSNLQDFRNRPIELGNRYVANVSGYLDDYSISIFNRSMTSPEARIWNGKILDYRLVRRLGSENEPMQIEHELIIYNPIANLKYIKVYNEIAAEAINEDDEPDVDVELVKDDAKTIETDMFDTADDRRKSEIKDRFIEYLDYLINDFNGIEYNRVQSKERAIELLAKDFVKDLTQLLEVLKTKVTISDILDCVDCASVEMFADDMPVVINLDDRFKTITIPDNLIDLRRLTIDLGNNYAITGQGNQDHFNIIIKNKAITSPRVKDENPGCAVLFYRSEKLECSNGKSYYKDSIFIKHPLANLNFIKHYISNLNFIRRYEASGSELVEKYLDEKKYEDVETHTLDVEEDSELIEDRDDTPVSESENTETVQSDTNKTLNFSLPGPNGSKISINLSINISFD
jgi:hypothetical protein